jgi:hypothetical protein
MTQQHSIIPPWELVQQWREAPEFSALSPCVIVTVTTTKLQDIATQAAQWSADIELEACCALLELYDDNARKYLQSARRPKPPSLKEQALEALAHILNNSSTQLGVDTIRRALEQLPDNN